MSLSKEYKSKKHSTTGNCEGETSDCNELKMIQLFKNEDKNQSRSLVFRISKFPHLQMPSSSTTMSFKKDKIFPSQHDSIQKFEKNCMKAQVCLSRVVLKEETNIHEACRNANDADNQTHSVAFETSEISPIQMPSGSFVKTSNKAKTFFSHQEVDFIENSEKVDVEVVSSPFKMPLNRTVKKEKISPCKPPKSLHRGRNPLNSFLFQKSETSKISSPSSSTVMSSNENIVFSYSVTDSTENLEENAVETVSSPFQISSFPAIKKENEPRRSLRLLLLQSKLNSSQEPEDQTANESATLKKSVSKANRKDSVENNRTIKMRSTKRKSSMNSTSSSSKVSRRMISETPMCPSSLNPTTMKLKSMMLFPSSTITQEEDSIHPRFQNADPSQVLSSLTQRRNITRSLKSGNAVSLFFPDKFIPQPVRSGQNCFPPSRMTLPQYKFRKTNIGELPLLKKKYPMIDPITLDKCYDMSHFSIRKTEIMLLDVIAGKEISSENIPVCSCHFLGRNNCSEVPYFYFHPHWIPVTLCKSAYEKRLPKECSYRDTLCRKIIIQSLKILNDEEAVL